MERAVLELARTAQDAGREHRLILFDVPPGRPDQLSSGSLQVEYLPRGGGIDRSFARALAHRIAALDPGVLHAHNDTAMVYARWAASLLRQASPRLVGTFHSWPNHDTLGARLSCRLATRGFERLTAVSGELARRLERAGWSRRLGVVPNGVNLETFHPGRDASGWRRRLGIGAEQLLVVHSARFDRIKRHEDLLEAFRKLESSAPELVLLCCGDGPELERLRTLFSALGNTRHVSRVERMEELWRAADLAVLCSEHEGTPMSLLEAMASGVPVLATGVGGVPELLQGVGSLVPSRCPDQLAAKLEAFARSSREQRSLAGAAARDRARPFSIERIALEWERVYSGSAGADLASPGHHPRSGA